MQHTGVSLAPTTVAREASTEAASDTSPAAAEVPRSGDFQAYSWAIVLLSHAIAMKQHQHQHQTVLLKALQASQHLCCQLLVRAMLPLCKKSMGACLTCGSAI